MPQSTVLSAALATGTRWLVVQFELRINRKSKVPLSAESAIDLR